MKTDQQLKSDVAAELAWDPIVNETRIGLTGEVDWGYQSASAEQCVHPLVGVRGVTNQIRLRQRANLADIRSQIESALARHAQREARRIAVEVDGGVVTLSGTVESMAELDAVMGTARAAKGVTRVVDQLEVID